MYAVDPDGFEFEVMWLTPEKFWGDSETSAVIEPLDLEGEIEKLLSDGISNVAYQLSNISISSKKQNKRISCYQAR